jgi:hypothetical protein
VYSYYQQDHHAVFETRVSNIHHEILDLPKDIEISNVQARKIFFGDTILIKEFIHLEESDFYHKNRFFAILCYPLFLRDEYKIKTLKKIGNEVHVIADGRSVEDFSLFKIILVNIIFYGLPGVAFYLIQITLFRKSLQVYISFDDAQHYTVTTKDQIFYWFITAFIWLAISAIIDKIIGHLIFQFFWPSLFYGLLFLLLGHVSMKQEKEKLKRLAINKN